MKKLKFYGIGGQGVVTAAKVLSSAVSLYEDKYAVTIPSYGHERRGAPVYTDIIIDHEPILLNCFVYEPDIVIVMDSEIIEKGIDIKKGVSSDTILVLNAKDEETVARYSELNCFAEIYAVDATKIAIKYIGKDIPNGSVLGALAATNIVSINSVERAIIEFFGNEAGEKNARAAREAYEAIKKI